MDVVDELLSGKKAAPKQRDVVDELLSPAPPVSAPPVSVAPPVGYMEGLQRAASQGVTMGFGDEIGAAARATVGPILGLEGSQAEGWSNRYSENLQAERDKAKAFAKDNPVASGAAEVAGGVLGAIPLAGAGMVGRVLAPRAGATMAGTMGRGAVAGGTGGAIAGFGSGEGGLENRVGNAIIPAAVGATVGGLAPPVVNVVGRVAGRVADATGLRNNSRAAMRQTLRAIGRDQAGGGPGLDDIRASMAANTGDNYRPEMLPDVAGENVRTLAERAARTPSAAAQTGKAAVRERLEKQAGRVMDDAARLVNPNRDYHGTIRALNEQKKTAAQPLYDEFFDREDIWSGRLQRLVENPRVKEGLRRGLAMLRDEADARGLPIPESELLGWKVGADGKLGVQRYYTPRVLDAAKRGLDDILEQFRDPVTGSMRYTPEARAIDEVRRAFIAEIDDLSKDGASYAAARAAYAGPSHAQDVMAMGRNIFSPDAEVTAEMVRKMSPNDKEYFAMGVVRAIRDKIMSAGDHRNAVARIWNTPLMREKLQAAFPDEKSFKQFGALMDREMRMADTGNRLLSGSRTEELRAAGDDMKIDPSFLNQAMQGNPVQGAVGAGIRYFFGPRTQGMNSATADELARILYSTNQGENMQTLARLAREASRPTYLSDRAMQELARRLTLGTGVSVGTQSN